MQLPQEAIEEFIELYKNQYGVLLSTDEATKRAADVYEFFKIVTKPVDKRAMRSFKMRKGVV